MEGTLILDIRPSFCCMKCKEMIINIHQTQTPDTGQFSNLHVTVFVLLLGLLIPLF